MRQLLFRIALRLSAAYCHGQLFYMSQGRLQHRDWSHVRAALAWIYEGAVLPMYRDDVCRPYFLGAWLMLAGKARLSQGGAVVEAGRGDWLILRQASGHQRFSDDARILSIRFTAEWPDRKPFYDEGLSTTMPSVRHPALEAAGRELLVKARPYLTDDPHQFRQQPMPFADFSSIELSFLAWFTELHAALESRGIVPTRTRLKDERIVSVLHKLDHLPLSAKVRESDLAKLAGLEVGHFVRTFRREVGTTPKRYFAERRRVACRRLMAASEIPIKEIALDLGFKRLSDFSAWFRAAEGVAPRDFRRTHQENVSPL